ncbi:MAG: hypothetical protein L0H26_10570, partial [Microlunatus sp.]|nr:hypothetical protein [Microlunatus sp.]
TTWLPCIGLTPGQVPAPDQPPAPVQVSVLDAGWEVSLLTGTGSWVGVHLTRCTGLVVVTRATIPGLRRLEHALTLLDVPDAVVAIVGLPRRGWPKPLTGAAGARTAAALHAGRVVGVPFNNHLALHGVDPSPLPDPLVAAGRHLHEAALAWRRAPDSPTSSMKGHS